MNPWYFSMIFVIYLPVSYAECNISSCSLLRELECALYTYDTNEKTLNQAFFPPRKATSRYIKVDYVFDTTEVDGMGDNCTVTYIWSIGGFLLIQPPSIFQLTSLMFSYPTNNITEMSLSFPSTCLSVIHTTSNRTCSCAGMENGTLDILTQQLLQYSKFSNPDRVVRDITSVAQALCVEDIEKGHFNNVDVITYIAAKLVLPVITSIVSVTLLYNYYPILSVRVTDPNDRPTFVGVLMAGIYLSLYIIAVDIAAIVFYLANKTEYQLYPTIAKSLSLQLVYYSFASECTLSAGALIVAAYLNIHFGNKRRYIWKSIVLSTRKIIFFILAFFLTFLTILAMVIQYPKTAFIISYATLWFAILVVTIVVISTYWTTPTNFFLIWFITVPLILGSAHIDYILVAWLTEPAKTTSVSILAIALIFYLFSLSRFLYKLITKLVEKRNWSHEKVQHICKIKWFKSVYHFFSPSQECLKLSFTFGLGLVGVGFASLQIAAFYLLPFPSIRLVDYLDNIFQISLVIFGGLITYKVISNQDADTIKLLKHSNMGDKARVKNTKTINSEIVEIKGKLTVNIPRRVRMNSNTNSTPEIVLQKSTLVVSIPQHQGCEETEIPVSGVELRNNWSNNNNRWHSSLKSSELDFYIFSNENSKCTVFLKNSTFMIENATPDMSNGFVADMEWLIIHNIDEPVLHVIKKSPCHDSCEIISLKENSIISLQIPVQCFIVNKSFLGVDNGTVCQFCHSISVLANNTNSGTKIVRIALPTKTSTHISFSRTNADSKLLNINGCISPISDGNAVTVKRHSTSILLKCSFNISNFRLSIRLDNDRKKLILQNHRRIDITIPLGHLKNGISIVALKVGQKAGTVNPSILYGPDPYEVYYSNILFTLQNDHEVTVNTSDNSSFAITSNFQYFEVSNVRTASIVITNPIPTEFQLCHESGSGLEPGWVNASWESSGEHSIIRYLEDQVPGLSLEVNSLAVNFPTFLYFPSIDQGLKTGN